MATVPTNKERERDLLSKNSPSEGEEGLLADQILGKQHREVAGLKEFTPHVPSAIEGGGRPLSEIPAATEEAVKKASEGVSPDAAKALGLPIDPKERLNVLLETLEGDGGDPRDLVEMLTGGDQLEDK